MAGGLDSFDWLKDRIKKPKALVDLSGIEELKGVRTTGDGIEIGAMTTLTEVVRHPVVKEKYGLLAQAAELVASPQIRNQGTLGGNVSQDARCWYYRAGWPCYRAGGNICYADTPVGRNREHAILHAERCVAVNPVRFSSGADRAGRQIRHPHSQRASAWWMPRTTSWDPTSTSPDMTHSASPDDLLTAIRIPSTWAGAQFYFEKVRDRNVWDFPLLNVASAMVVSGDTIREHPHCGERRRRPAVAIEGSGRLQCAASRAAPRPVRWRGNWQYRERSRCSSTPTRSR